MKNYLYDVCIVGGAGHVGLPLGISFAQSGKKVVLYDIDSKAIDTVLQGRMPFMEKGAEDVLKNVLGKNLSVSSDKEVISDSYFVVIVIGTPVDEHLNPELSRVFEVIEQIKPHLRNDQVIILRSTLFPGMSEKIYASLKATGLNVGVSFCPERIAQGKALIELSQIPQIISAGDRRTLEIVRSLFSTITPYVIELSMIEAELAKLFSNAWRYIKFAVANQFYMIAAEKGLDFYRVREAMMFNYERAADFPTAGLKAFGVMPKKEL